MSHALIRGGKLCQREKCAEIAGRAYQCSRIELESKLHRSYHFA